MFVAGTETSSNTLLMGLLYMVENPDIQKRVQTDIDQLVGKSDMVRLEHRGKEYCTLTQHTFDLSLPVYIVLSDNDQYLCYSKATIY